MAAELEALDEPVGAAVTSAVTTSFAFGWQMARLYAGTLSSAAKPTLGAHLPGLSSLPGAQLVALGLAQCDAALARLKTFLGNVPLPNTDAVRAETGKRSHDRDAILRAILNLHIDVLIQLTAADYRLGKAYGLGRALADTCAAAHGDDAERRQALVDHLEPHRALVITAWLDDLKTVLPAHASQGVADSLRFWERWASGTELGALEPAAVTAISHDLHRCGQQWRAILSGEKDATDLLQISDYVSAARGALASASAFARSLAARFWVPLALAGVLIVVGIWLITVKHSSAQVIAGLGTIAGGLATIAGGLGITWRGAAGTLGHVSLDLVRPLWGAQLDIAVASRLTPATQRDYRPAVEPASRWRRAWRALRSGQLAAVRTAFTQAGSGQPAETVPTPLADLPDSAVAEAEP